MSARIDAFDWSSTPLGPIESWPQSLRTAVRIVLTSRFSMWMTWGPDLTVFYNDAYRHDTLGVKHPWALGRPAREVWAEIWEDIEPRIATVLADGTATWDEALQLFLERSGYREETYHTFSYSPLAGRRRHHRRPAVRRRRGDGGRDRRAAARDPARPRHRGRGVRQRARPVRRRGPQPRPQPAGPPVHAHLHLRARRRHPAGRRPLARRGDARRVAAAGRRPRRRRRRPAHRRLGGAAAPGGRSGARRPRPAATRRLPRRRPQPVPPARRGLPRLHRAAGRADRRQPRERPRTGGRAPARAGAGRAGPREDRLLLQRQPRVPHAAVADPRARRGRAGRRRRR